MRRLLPTLPRPVWRDAEDTIVRHGVPPPRIVPLLLALAIFVAPLLGLVVSVKVGLGLMAIAQSATAFLLREAIRGAPERARQLLRLVVALNVALAIACVAAMVALAATG
jgi:hypothetical protein